VWAANHNWSWKNLQEVYCNFAVESVWAANHKSFISAWSYFELIYVVVGLLYTVLKRISEISGTAILSRKSASQQTKVVLSWFLGCVCVCVLCRSIWSCTYIYIYFSEVILGALISSGAHREGFHLNLIFVSACSKTFLWFLTSDSSAALVIYLNTRYFLYRGKCTKQKSSYIEFSKSWYYRSLREREIVKKARY
jgi:hypothetical protein